MTGWLNTGIASYSPDTPVLAAFDFDGTTHLTNRPAPNGMTVADAYDIAVQQVFGDDAYAQYNPTGGLHNRAPAEITAQLAGTVSVENQFQKTQDLIDAKIALLGGQVGQYLPDGSIWPNLNPGFEPLWAQLNEVDTVTTSVISSGHEKIIARAYEVHDLAPPHIMVTTEDFDELINILPVELCVKPSRLLVDIAHQRWLARLGLQTLATSDPEAFVGSFGYIFYAGDDRVKDGMMAEHARTQFVHIEPGKSEAGFAWYFQRMFPFGIK